MATQKSILFVCTGNIFRSLSAELGFKKYLSDAGITGWNVESAGIVAEPQPVDPKTLETLQELGMDGTSHEQKKLTREMLDSYDVVVGMAQNHIDFMKSELGYKYGILFNELALHENTSVLDIEDEIIDYKTNRPAIEEKIERTVKEIAGKIPALFENVSERFYLFSDYAEGARTHRNGYPFITLHETPHSLAFMSLDIPSTADGHILVIPKKRYRNLSEIPNDTLADISVSLKKIGDALDTHHDGYNILLNNGVDAGQYIMHTHFHVIPRKNGDGITFEGWTHQEISLEDFLKMNAVLKAQIDRS